MKQAIGLLLLSSSLFAQTTCKVTFSVVWKDELNNLNQGLSNDDAKWFQKKLAKKYPDICYASPSESVRLVFFVQSSSSTFHGSRTRTSTQEVPLSGTVTDDSGNTSRISGSQTVQSSSTEPYSFDYPVYTLSIEQLGDAGAPRVLHNLQKKGICPTLYGVCVKNRHPHRGIIEDAVKWIHNGGLNDPLQSVAAPGSQ